jgi:hypothetical protein
MPKVRKSWPTIFKRIPVSVGRTKEPQKKTPQMHANAKGQELRNGTGIAVIAARVPTTAQRPKDLRDLYPPIWLKMIPPRETPINGAVKHVTT